METVGTRAWILAAIVLVYLYKYLYLYLYLYSTFSLFKIDFWLPCGESVGGEGRRGEGGSGGGGGDNLVGYIRSDDIREYGNPRLVQLPLLTKFIIFTSKYRQRE